MPAWWSGSGPTRSRPTGWATVTVKAASLNHHDLWSLRGVGLREEALPMILGCDAAGHDEDGNEVVVHAVISDPDWSGDETLRPQALAALRALTRARSPTGWSSRGGTWSPSPPR